MQAASKHLVFVFGTLKENFPNHHKNTGVRQAGSFCTTERYPLYLVGERHSPWLLEQPGVGHRVAGEVFEMTDAGLAAMDVFERVGEKDGYHRTAVSISGSESEGAGDLIAFVYFKKPETLDHADVKAGPLSNYTPEHAALYRARK